MSTHDMLRLAAVLILDAASILFIIWSIRHPSPHDGGAWGFDPDDWEQDD